MKKLLFILFLLMTNSLFASETTDFNKANALYREQKFEDSLESYKKLFETDLKAKAYFNAGNAAFKLQQMDEAIEFYKKAIDLNRKDFDARFNLELAESVKKQQKQQPQKDKKNEKQNKKDEQKQQQQQQPEQKKAGELSKEEAEQLIEALSTENKKTQKQVETAANQFLRQKGKDW